MPNQYNERAERLAILISDHCEELLNELPESHPLASKIRQWVDALDREFGLTTVIVPLGLSI
jgi:hypothetical protein